VLCVTILAMYSFTDWIRVLSGMAPVGIVFTMTRFVAAILPFIKREGHRTSPRRLQLVGLPSNS
jgi:hypothetical protein